MSYQLNILEDDYDAPVSVKIFHIFQFEEDVIEVLDDCVLQGNRHDGYDMIDIRTIDGTPLIVMSCDTDEQKEIVQAVFDYIMTVCGDDYQLDYVLATSMY